ncbi:MAG: hypothetical protein M3P83_08795, partial [Actinomycetota bacterium]|nr:hypothetical protein [Actinomycetota bacterium]
MSAQELPVGDAVARLWTDYDDPFLRRQLDPASVRAVHRHRNAVVLEHAKDRRGRAVRRPLLTCLGRPEELRPVLAELAATLGAVPARVTIDATAVEALPPGREYARARTWDFMWTDAPPPPYAGAEQLEVLHDLDEVDALLDRANPDTHGR